MPEKTNPGTTNKSGDPTKRDDRTAQVPGSNGGSSPGSAPMPKREDDGRFAGNDGDTRGSNGNTPKKGGDKDGGKTADEKSARTSAGREAPQR